MSKKDMVSLIKKRAQELADPPGVDMKKYRSPGASPAPPHLPPPPAPPLGTSVAPTAPKAKPSAGTIYTKSKTIGDMQNELRNLAQSVTSEIGANTLAAGTEQSPEAQQEAAGRLAFSNFITENYIRHSDLPAVEYDPNPAKTDISEKDPSKATRMNVVMDTMSRIGSPKSEFVSDGVWGPRTNAALRNAYALAFGLLKMSKDFKFDPVSYAEGNLQQLKDEIPLTENSISPAEKIKRAPEIIKHLIGIRKLFLEVKNHILNKPAYRSYIEGTQPYATYQKNQAVSPQTIEDLNKRFTNMTVAERDEDGNLNPDKSAHITVSDLATPQAFQLWLQTNLPNVKPEDALGQIKKHLNETDVSRGTALK